MLVSGNEKQKHSCTNTVGTGGLCQHNNWHNWAVPAENCDSAGAFFPRFLRFLKDRVFRDFPAFFELFCCPTRTHSALFGQQRGDSAGAFFPRFLRFLKDRVFRDFPAFFELFCCPTRTHSALFGQQRGGFVLKYDERLHQRLVTD